MKSALGRLPARSSSRSARRIGGFIRPEVRYDRSAQKTSAFRRLPASQSASNELDVSLLRPWPDSVTSMDGT